MKHISLAVIGLIVAIELILFQNFTFTQVTQEWLQRYNGSGNNNDIARSIAVDLSGNVYITGESQSSGTASDYATIKYNTSGIQQWVTIYNYNDSIDEPSSLAIDAFGNVYVTGRSGGNGTGFDYATIKYNTSGVQQWFRRYDGPAGYSDEASAIEVDGSGCVYVTGKSMGEKGYLDIVTIKYNPAGEVQWLSTFDGPQYKDDAGRDIAVDNSGNVYVTGWTNLGGAANFVTVKYTNSGVQQWAEVYYYGGPSNYPTAIALDAGNNVYSTGARIGGGSSYDYTTFKFNSSGVQQWLQWYNGPGNGADIAHSIAIDLQGNVYLTGESWGGVISYDYATIKYDSSGNELWVTRYNGPGNEADIAYSIVVDSSGNQYITGKSVGTTWPDFDYCTIKYNSSGIQQWIMRYNGPGNNEDEAYAIANDASGNIYVTGGSKGAGTGYDFATIKYSQVIGIKPTGSEIPHEYSLFQNYPNPFNPITKIRFSLPYPSKGGAQDVKLTIYDILGREAATLVNEQLQPGTYEIEWDASNFASGIYYYSLETQEFNKTKKMILIK
jgi:hypothetical protein